METQVIKWKPTGSGNYIKRIDDDTYISYNPTIKNSIWDELAVGLGGATSREGEDETALKHKGVWRILNGNFMEEYDKCKTAAQCLAVYRKHKKKFRSDFSTD